MRADSAGTTAPHLASYLYDGDSLLEELDQRGNVLARYTQGPPLIDESLSERSTGTLTNPFQFAGREFDQETGIYYNRMRYYDSNSGRFVSEDPWAFDLEWPNLYLYAKNRPTGLIDPLGLSPQTFGPFVCTWCGEFTEGSLWMWEGYTRMRDMKWRNSDKYFHYMANCRATNAGSGGAAAAKIISFFRTGVRSRWTEPTDWRNDRVANTCGQKGGDCDKTCAPFWPKSSPGNPPFPGWPNQ